MDRRTLISLLGAATLLYACGPHPQGVAEQVDVRALAEPGPVHAKTARLPAGRAVDPRGRDTVDATLAVEVAGPGAPAQFALAVVNTSHHRVEVDFPDGRTRDFAVYDAGGREVWRWSKGRMFTQVMQNKLLAAHDSTVYAGAWQPAAPGRYTVVAELRSETHPIRRALAFVVPAPRPAATVAEGRDTGRAPAPPAGATP